MSRKKKPAKKSRAKSRLKLRPDRPDGIQIAALCFRIRKKRVQVLMVTSRRTKRWILPKGWSEPDMTLADAAAKEAWEEAGVRGTVWSQEIGRYSYVKKAEAKGEHDLVCTVHVFPLMVDSLRGDFPEKGQRKRKWMGRKKAAGRVWEKDLAKMIRNFDPRG